MHITTSEELRNLLLDNGWYWDTKANCQLICPYNVNIYFNAYTREFVKTIPLNPLTHYRPSRDAILLKINNLKDAKLLYDSNTNLLSNEIMAIRIK